MKPGQLILHCDLHGLHFVFGTVLEDSTRPTEESARFAL